MCVLPHSWQLQIAGEHWPPGLCFHDPLLSRGTSWAGLAFMTPWFPVAPQHFQIVMFESLVHLLSKMCYPSHVSVESPNWTVNSVPLLLHVFFPCPNQFFHSGISRSYKHAVIFIICLLTLLPNSSFLLFFVTKFLERVPWP